MKRQRMMTKKKHEEYGRQTEGDLKQWRQWYEETKKYVMNMKTEDEEDERDSEEWKA